MVNAVGFGSPLSNYVKGDLTHKKNHHYKMLKSIRV